MPVRLYYSDHYRIPLPPGHRFPAEKYALVRSLLENDPALDLQPAPLAGRADIERVHDAEYVRRIFDGSIDPAIMRRIGFPWSPELVRRSLASVGGTLAAARDALDCGIGGNLAGGTHHAFREHGAGFCVFNDLAIAIRACGRRAAVIDLDVHQGDGTAAIFAGDPDVLTLSIHAANNFPFQKQKSRIDVALPDGTSDEEYLSRLSRCLSAVAQFQPGIVLYQAGVDSLDGDRLGRLRLSPAGLAERDRIVMDLCRINHFPLVVTMGGGYSQPIARTAEAHAVTFREARYRLARIAT
jgi:acetoin utilization deacetylase AcuC-like enzyme